MQREMRRALVGITVLVFGFFAVAAMVPIGGAVLGSGQVGSESRVKRIAHPTGGVIAEIYVANGDRVERGDPLVRLDATVSGAEAAFSALTVSQLLAQRARLEAERLGSGAIVFSPELLRSSEPGARQAMADEARLFAIRRSELGGLRAQMGSRVVQLQRQIEGYRAQIDALQRQAVLIEPERAGVRELWEKDLVTVSRKNQLERESVDLQGSIASLNAQIAQTQARITETREQAIQLSETRRSEAGTQLAALNASLNDQRVRNVSSGEQKSRSLVRAPYAGVVDKLAVNAIGDVVPPAQTILEVVPDRDRLVIEAAVSPTDIDQVRQGQSARLRFSSFSATSTPEIPGEVTFVAAERTTDPDTQSSFYSVRLSIDAARLAKWPELRLKPGMPADVMIETGDRSMLSYITRPLRDQFARAFRN